MRSHFQTLIELVFSYNFYEAFLAVGRKKLRVETHCLDELVSLFVHCDIHAEMGCNCYQDFFLAEGVKSDEDATVLVKIE
jgi:hypothetical protein